MRASSSPRSLPLAGLLVAAVLAAYWPAVHGGFLFDDDALVSQSPIVQAADGLKRIWFTTEPIDYWPVTNSSFWVEWRLWGPHPTGYHLTNVFLHAASVLLVWRVLRMLPVPGAFWGALLFAVHPMNVQSVAWIAQRKNTLAMLFFLLSILWFLKDASRRSEGQPAVAEQRRSGRRGKRPPKAGAKAGPLDPWTSGPLDDGSRWYWLSLAAFVLAMLSKGSVAVLPGVLLVLLWWQRQSFPGADLRRLWPFFAVAIVFTLVNVWFQARAAEPIRDVTLVERVLGAGGVVWFYLSKAVAPVGLTFMYPQWDVRAGDLRWWTAIAAAAAVTVLLLRARRRRVPAALLAAWLFFCLALVPVLGLADVYFMKYTLVADHYAYIALLAVTTMAGAAIGSLRRPALRAVAGGGLAVALGVAAWGQAHLYADPEVLYRATIERNPSAWALYNNLGALLIDRGHDEEAVSQLHEGLRLNPRLAAAHNNLCVAEVHLGRFDAALAECSEAARNDPKLAMAHANLGIALMASGRLREAEPQLETAIGLEPGYTEAHYNLAHLLVVTGRAGEAVPHLREVLRRMPDSGAAHDELGQALEAVGESAEAEAAFRDALRLRPDFAEAHRHLADLLQRLGRTEEAAAEYGKIHGNGR